MARPKSTNPQKYLVDGNWRVKIAGRSYRLGGDEVEAERQRQALVGQWLLDQSKPPEQLDDHSANGRKIAVSGTIDDALAEYLERGLRPTLDRRQVTRIKRAVLAVCEVYGAKPAADFGALELKRVRSVLLRQRAKAKRNHKSAPAALSRNYINDLVGCIKTAWDWCASERLAPGWRAHELRTVKALREGDGGAELPVTLPPPVEAIDAALARMSGPVAAMVRLQRLTGMRPAEVCGMRRGELSLSPAEILTPPNAPPVAAFASQVGALVWVYAPSKHKTRRKGKPRLIALGPTAQAILLPFILRGPVLESIAGDTFLFRPTDVQKCSRAKQDHYTVSAYANAVRRACRRAGVPVWQPRQLRHALATELFADDPLTAMATLGHSQLSMTQLYSSVNLKRAGEHAARNG